MVLLSTQFITGIMKCRSGDQLQNLKRIFLFCGILGRADDQHKLKERQISTGSKELLSNNYACPKTKRICSGGEDLPMTGKLVG